MTPMPAMHVPTLFGLLFYTYCFLYRLTYRGIGAVSFRRTICAPQTFRKR
ncbi:MAG: hypothetical protein WCC15_12450 [Candidatus Acidiferrales bacterium]